MDGREADWMGLRIRTEDPLERPGQPSGQANDTVVGCPQVRSLECSGWCGRLRKEERGGGGGDRDIYLAPSIAARRIFR